MLGQYFIGQETAVSLYGSLRNHAAAFLEQVRQDARVLDVNGLGGIGDAEYTARAGFITFQTAFFNQTTNSKRLTSGRFAFGNLCWRKKEHQIALKSVQYQCSGDAQGAQPGSDPDHPLLSRLHSLLPLTCVFACVITWSVLASVLASLLS